MSLLSLILIIFLACLLVGIIIWAWPQLSMPAPIKNAILIALIILCVILLIWLILGGGVGRLNLTELEHGRGSLASALLRAPLASA